MPVEIDPTPPPPAEPSSEKLISIAELAAWSQQSIAENDAYANLVLDAASLVVRETASQPTWTAATAPGRAKLICAVIARRAWINPDGAKNDPSLGPLGSTTYIDEVARGMNFDMTDRERAELEAMAPSGDVPGTGIFSIGFATRPSTPAPPIYYDDSGSDWSIPVLGRYQ